MRQGGRVGRSLNVLLEDENFAWNPASSSPQGYRLVRVLARRTVADQSCQWQFGPVGINLSCVKFGLLSREALLVTPSSERGKLTSIRLDG
eukprot:4223209-Amphidinium_carterae.1